MTKKILQIAPVVLGLSLMAVARPAAAGYSIQTITDPTGNNFINLLGINNAGEIGGFDNNNPAQGLTLTLPNHFTSQNFPGSTSSMVTAINNNGDTAGIYTDTANNTHGYTHIGGIFRTVDDPASTVFNQALGINNAGNTVGYYAPTQAGATGQIAYEQTQGKFININASLPSNMNSQAVGINSSNSIVGASSSRRPSPPSASSTRKVRSPSSIRSDPLSHKHLVSTARARSSASTLTPPVTSTDTSTMPACSPASIRQVRFRPPSME